jgi:hypothetical protein
LGARVPEYPQQGRRPQQGLLYFAETDIRRNLGRPRLVVGEDRGHHRAEIAGMPLPLFANTFATRYT